MRRNYKLFAKINLILLCCLLFLANFSLMACADNGGQDIADGVTFTDALNRRVTVKKQPKRVASLLGSFSDVWVLSGGRLCASADDAWDDFNLDLKDAVNIGGAHSPSLELLVSSNPDFVIASASTASNVNMKDTLESMGITVAYFDVDNFNDYLEMLNICTDITERKDLYKTNGTDIKEQIDIIKSNYKNHDDFNNTRSVLLLRASSTSIKAKGSEGTILGEMLFDMGCENIADNDKTLLENLSIEAITIKNPYHVFVVTMGSNTDKAIQSLENMIKENPAWNTLDAIKKGRLHIMDKTLFNLKPNARWAVSYQKLYDALTE